MSESGQVRVRIAPSPTGDPHVGTAYVALFNYVFAKAQGGKFILRIEDTDRQRFRATSEQQIIDTLSWLGLQWDEGPDCGGEFGPYRQSERQAIYQEYVQILLDKGEAYRCFCSAERLAEVRVSQKGQGLRMGYDRTCRSLPRTDSDARAAAGEEFVIRLKMPEAGSTNFVDVLRGEVAINNEQLDDQVLMKSDGFPTYHLANVVDDRLMKITHVIRAEEWISSTPKHVVLYRAFGWEEPKWVHLPLLRNTDKSKISKRKNPVSLNYYRRAGFLPEALRNFLALMGWNPGDDIEIFNLEQMIEQFQLQKIHLGSPVFDLVKLTWLNKQYLQKLDQDRFSTYIREQMFSEQTLLQLYPLVLERMSKFEDFIPNNAFFFSGALDYSGVELVPKKLDIAEFRKGIKDLVEQLDDLYEWTPESLQSLMATHRERLGWRPRDYFMSVRLITTGRPDSPPLAETMAVLGRDMVRFRLRDVLERLKP